MCLGHLRHVKLSQIARQRLFKKTEQTAILELLSLIYLPPDAGEVVEEHLFDAGEAAEAEQLALAALAPVASRSRNDIRSDFRGSWGLGLRV